MDRLALQQALVQGRRNKQESVQWFNAEMTAFLTPCGFRSCASPSIDDGNCLTGPEPPTEKWYLNMCSNKLGIMVLEVLYPGSSSTLITQKCLCEQGVLKGERWRIDECPLLLPWSLWDKISTAALYVHYSFHWSAKGSAIGNFTMMPSVLSTAPCWISLPWRDDPLLLEISKGWRRCLSLQQIPELCSFPSPLAKSSAFPTTSLALSPHKD